MPYGPPPPAKRNGLKIGLIIGAVVLVLLCLCGVLVVVGLSRLADSDSVADAPAPRPNLTAEADETEDPGFGQEFDQGDCVVNDGTDSNADLRKVPCSPGTYQVVLKIPFTTDGDDCKLLAPDADADYVHDSPLNSADYVLCLKKQ